MTQKQIEEAIADIFKIQKLILDLIKELASAISADTEPQESIISKLYKDLDDKNYKV